MAIPIKEIVSGVTGLVGGFLGTRAEQKRSDNRIRYLSRLRSDAKADFDRDYYEDPMSRAAVQRMLTKTMEGIRQRNRAAAGTAAVMGSSEETVANEKAVNANALADTASQIAASADEEKRRLKQQYKERDDRLQEMLADERANRPTGSDVIANMIGGAANGIGKHYG